MSDVEPTENEIQTEMEWRGEEEAERRASEPARPVEDRDPVGPYAPTRGAELAGHIEFSRGWEAGARATRERHQVTADQNQYKEGFRAGVKIGAAEQEARILDRPFVETETELPSAYDVAERTLQAATCMVIPVSVEDLPEKVKENAAAVADTATVIADRLFGWLWQFTDMDGPDTGDVPPPYPQSDPASVWAGRVAIDETCGSCSQPRERHDPGCLYAPRERTGDPWAPPLPGKQPCCGASLDAHFGDCDQLGAEKGEQVVEPRPQVEACPECRSGKHDNCPGRVLDEGATELEWTACPCAGESHPESLG